MRIRELIVIVLSASVCVACHTMPSQEDRQAQRAEWDHKAGAASTEAAASAVKLQDCAIAYATAHRASGLTATELTTASLSACHTFSARMQSQFELAMTYVDPYRPVQASFDAAERMSASMIEQIRGAVLRSIAESPAPVAGK